MLFWPLNSTCSDELDLPLVDADQPHVPVVDVIGWIWVGDWNGARLEPSLTGVPPTVMSSTSRPPSLTPPSLT